MKEFVGEAWAIVELMGHNQIAGYVSPDTSFGHPMIRVDVPDTNGKPGFTKFFNGSAIYGITPTTEEIVKAAAARFDVRPIAVWVLPDPKPQLSEGDTKWPDL